MKNYTFLLGSFSSLGFDGVFDEALKGAMLLGKPEFNLRASLARDDKAISFDFKLARKDEESFYFLNNVVTTYKKGEEPALTHDFFLYKQQGYKMHQMFNLMEGRSVHSDFFREGRQVELWRRIDFTAKDERGNNLMRTTYVNNNKFNIEAELEKLPIQGLNTKEKEMLLLALKSGDAPSVVVKQGSNRENVSLVAMPHISVIAAFNAQGERVSLTNNMLKVVVSDEQPALSETTKQMVEATNKNSQAQANEQTQAPSQGRRKAS